MTQEVEILDGMMGSGKALLNGTPVVTEFGYRNIEDLCVGDRVYGEDGNLHNVLGVYPQGKKTLYKVTFSDRNSIVCCEDHLWTYQKPHNKSKGVFRTAPLKEIMRTPLFKQTNKCKNWQIHIPISKPVNFHKKELLIDPYLLGLMLGDGGFGESMSFTNSESDIVEKFKSLVAEEMLSYDGNNTTSFRLKRLSTYKSFRSIYNKDVRSENKFIPIEYLTSSVEDRLSLIKGLMDTDGYCCGGYFEYSTSSKQLCSDAKFLLESVGCTVTVSNIIEPKFTYKGEVKTGLNAYRILVRHEDLKLLCSSKKHLDKIKDVNTKPNRTIRNIEYYGEDDCTCIMVDNPSKLFLTEHFIPTHNTTSIVKWMESNNNKYKFFYISPLLDEVKDGGRIQQACPTTRFIAPETIQDDKLRNDSEKKGNQYKRKSEHLLYLLSIGANITCTHNLYLTMTEDHFREMKKHDYVLIIDEELGMIDDYKSYTSPDVQSLIKLGCLEVQDKDGMLIWTKDNLEEFDNYSHQYYNFKRHVDNNMIYVSKRDANIFVCQLPIKLITIAQRCIILTYMFEGNILSSFVKLKGLTYKPFNEVTLNIIDKSTIKSLITLYEPKLNKWKKDLKLSVTAYSKLSSNDIKHITNYINAITKEFNSSDYDTMFTFPKNRCNLSDNKQTLKIKPKGMVDSLVKYRNNPDNICWIASGTRATNKYRHKSTVIHAYDRYPNQSVASYLQDFNHPVDARIFALSEMVQWIWRSRIRDGKSINLAILSNRMKLLFLNWLNDLPLDNEDLSKFS